VEQPGVHRIHGLRGAKMQSGNLRIRRPVFSSYAIGMKSYLREEQRNTERKDPWSVIGF
jgi:hypothetical protein